MYGLIGLAVIVLLIATYKWGVSKGKWGPCNKQPAANCVENPTHKCCQSVLATA